MKTEPITLPEPEVELSAELPQTEEPSETNEFNDDRDIIRPGDHVVLMVENDPTFAQLLLETAREAGMKGIATSRGAAALTWRRNIRSVRRRWIFACPTSTVGEFYGG